jgi:hypothetical protein
VDRQAEARRLAEELLGDIELERLKASEVVLKASRLARLVGHEDLTTFLGYERNGYPLDGTATAWIERAGRWSDKAENRFYPQAIAKIEAELASASEAIGAMRGGGNYSGDMANLAAGNHDNRIGQQARLLSVWTGISGQVVATVYDLVSEIYHELVFSDLQATLFADTQARVDGSLAEASGSALEKIESVSDRLRDGHPESVSQALTTCRRLITSCADHLFPAREEKYDLGEGATLAVGESAVLNRLQAHVHQAGASRVGGSACAGHWRTCGAGARPRRTPRSLSRRRGSSSSRPTSCSARC